MAEKHILFYEGGCAICERFIAWIRRKGDKIFVIYPYQTAPEPPMNAHLRKACERAIHVITTDGEILRGARATLFVLEKLGWGGFARFLQLPPFLWFGEIVYELVARNRKWLEKLFR